MRVLIVFINVIFLLGAFYYSRSFDKEATVQSLLSMHLVHGKMKSGSEPTNYVPGDFIILSNSDGESFILKKTPIFTDKDFLWISLHKKPHLKNGDAIEFRLSESAQKRLADVTIANIGKEFAIVLNSEVISAPVVREPILDGRGLITGKNMRGQIDRLRKVVKTKAPSTFCKYLPQFLHSTFECL